MADSQPYPARLYKPNSGQAIPVELRLEIDQLAVNFAEEQCRISLYDLELEIGGHAEDRIKLHDCSSGATLLCEDRQLIRALASYGQYPVCQAARKALARIQAAGKGVGIYWTKIVFFITGGIVVLYFALDWGVTATFMNVSPAVESKIGEFLVAEKVKQANSSSPAYKRVNAIGNKLVAHISANPYKFRFLVAADKTLNACAYPGGTTFVNQGLLDNADDDELAAVMGHEIGHVIRRHSLRSMGHSLGLWTMLKILCITVGNNADIEKISAAMNLGEKLESLQFSRSQESEADQIGVSLAVESGYRGDALMTFFQRLQRDPQTADNKAFAILSDHPMNSERIEAIKMELAHLKAEGKQVLGSAVAKTSLKSTGKRTTPDSFCRQKIKNGT